MDGQKSGGRGRVDDVEYMHSKLIEEVFQHRQSPRKAAGRAIGTLIEIITYYMLISWGFKDSISLETQLPEYGNSKITHNVEYSLHPIENKYGLKLKNIDGTLSCKKINRALQEQHNVLISKTDISESVLLSKNNILKNACIINKNKNHGRYIANLENIGNVTVIKQKKTPYMMFECKRVGKDAKSNPGPQSIEKAKQGSYVTRTISSLQKIRDNSGNSIGVIYDENNNPIIKKYDDFLHDMLNTNRIDFLKGFIMTVGIISNHGNWFTFETQNKEMMILTQSYDWVIFLTDYGLRKFIETVILNKEKYPNINHAFEISYNKNNTTGTQFTKVKMNYNAHCELVRYFETNQKDIESWFNVIQPKNASLDLLKHNITSLKQKWSEMK